MGGGIAFEPAVIDMTAWTHLYISLKSERESFASFTIGMISQDASGSEAEVNLNASDYGFVVDGQWHSLRIPTVDFAPVDLSSVYYALTLVAQGVTSSESILVDDVYFTAEVE